MQLIQKHGSLEAVMAQLDTARYGIPDPFPFSEARVLFKGRHFAGCFTQLNVVQGCCAVSLYSWLLSIYKQS